MRSVIGLYLFVLFLAVTVRHLLVSLKSNNGLSMKNDTQAYVTRLLAVVMKKYGATPFFKVIVKKNGDITVSVILRH
jgi:hypothetical protein